MSDVAIVVLAAVFALVFIFSLTALASAGMFSRTSRFTAAICVAGLCVLALLQMCPSQSGEPIRQSKPNPLISGLLLPYAALGITLIVLLLMLATSRVLNRLRGASRDVGHSRDQISQQDSTTERSIKNDR